ncbi:MAG: hypothetical protein AAGI11_23220 [Pseudomonadota bacterium]
MKTVASTLIVALGLALPTLASAMTAEQSVHTDKARAILEQAADTSNPVVDRD